MPKLVTYIDPNNDERFHAGERFTRGASRELPDDWIRNDLAGASDYPGSWSVSPLPKPQAPDLEDAPGEQASDAEDVVTPAPKPKRKR